MSYIYLKVKIKSLAEEARIIRKEEQKALKQFRYFKNKGDTEQANKCYSLYYQLRMHRIWNVRDENRAALIAYAYIRKKKYSSLETYFSKYDPEIIKNIITPQYSSTVLSRAARLIFKYGTNIKQFPSETAILEQLKNKNYTKQPKTIDPNDFSTWLRGKEA